MIAKADGGILFLDEIHRLPPEGQEMLFTFIDKGVYRPLGESAHTLRSLRPDHRRDYGILRKFPLPRSTAGSQWLSLCLTFASRSLDERYEIISLFIKQEANRLNQRIDIEKRLFLAFMLYDAEGNIGQVKRDLKLVCAKSFLHYRTHNEEKLIIRKEELSLQVQRVIEDQRSSRTS